MGHKISKLYVEMSSACNLNCRMCFRNSWFNEKSGLMSDIVIENVKKIMTNNETEGIFIGGMGEPLMHERVFELIETATVCGIKSELITNATLLNSENCKKLISAGLNTLWISMDGFTKESYENVRKGSLYNNIIENIEIFNRNRTNTNFGITFVMMKENSNQFEHINAFADKYNVDIINLSHVVPCDELKKENSVYEMPYPIGKMHRFDKNEVFKKKINYCPFVEDNVCFVRYDGEICPCMQLLHNSYTYLYEEKRKVYSHSFGNICDNSLKDILNGTEYNAFIKRVKEFDFPGCTICLGCDDRKENIIDCMYNEKPTCGACLWAQGLIRCP